MIADYISGSREATNVKTVDVEYITTNTFPFKFMRPKKITCI